MIASEDSLRKERNVELLFQVLFHGSRSPTIFFNPLVHISVHQCKAFRKLVKLYNDDKGSTSSQTTLWIVFLEIFLAESTTRVKMTSMFGSSSSRGSFYMLYISTSLVTKSICDICTTPPKTICYYIM